MTTSTQTPTKILCLRQACDKVGIGRSSIYTLIAAGKFPKPIQLTARNIGFFEHELDAWLSEKASQRA